MTTTTGVAAFPSASYLGQIIPQAPPVVPYRGIESFRLADAAIFFARERDRRRLLRFVTVYRGVLLYGDSGVGKSSLINAGLLPDVIGQGFIPERLRVQPLEANEFVVERISIGGDDRPPFFPSFFVDDDARDPRPSLSASTFLEKVRGIPPDRQLLLIFDQFEEFFTLFEEAPSAGELAAAQEAQSRVISALTSVLNEYTIPVKLVFAFREEYLSKLAKLFHRHPGLTDQAVRLTPPNVKEIESIIVGPLEKFRKQFGNHFSATLIARLTAAFRDRFQDQPVNLSEVQIACWQLWRADEPSAVFVEKGLTGLIEAFFSEQFDKVSQEDRPLATALLARMITQSGARNYVSKGDLTSLIQVEISTDADHIGRVLFVLDKETRLVRRELRQNVTYYTIISEFLVPWIRQRNGERVREWERIKAERLLAEERAEAERRLELELTRAAEEVAARRAKAIKQLLWVAISVIIVLALLVVQLARQRGALQKLALERSTQAQALRDTAALLNLQAKQLELSRDSLTTAMVRLENANTVLRKIVSRNRAVAELALTSSQSPPREEVVPLVYIQFRGDLSRDLLEDFRAELNQSGFAAPGNERIQRQFSSRVSYFRQQDRIFAEAVAMRAERFFEQNGCPVNFPLLYLPEYVANADPRQVEVWINHNCPR